LRGSEPGSDKKFRKSVFFLSFAWVFLVVTTA